jgi:hypothetical protein
MKPAPPELARPYKAFARHLVERIRTATSEGDLPVNAACAEALVRGAEALETHSVDAELRAIRELLSKSPDQSAAAIARIDRFVGQ